MIWCKDVLCKRKYYESHIKSIINIKHKSNNTIIILIDTIENEEGNMFGLDQCFNGIDKNNLLTLENQIKLIIFRDTHILFWRIHCNFHDLILSIHGCNCSTKIENDKIDKTWNYYWMATFHIFICIKWKTHIHRITCSKIIHVHTHTHSHTQTQQQQNQNIFNSNNRCCCIDETVNSMHDPRLWTEVNKDNNK